MPASIKPLRGWRLQGDLRIEIFALVFALGTIHHEVQQALEAMQAGPYTEYMERWARARPTFGWPSEVGLVLHMADIVLSLLILALPRRRELLCALAVTFLVSNLFMPEEIDSHNSLMAAGLAVVLYMGIGEWTDRALRRGRSRREATDWLGWTLTGLAWVAALLYFFAFVYKLNPSWFSVRLSQGTVFLVAPLAPLLAPFGFTRSEVREIVGPLAIHATLILELALPVLLFVRRTRLFGCLLGLLFHLPMMVQGVTDFPTVMLAFYAAFLSPSQARELVRRCLAPPSALRLAITFALGGYGIWIIRQAGNVGRFYRDSPGLDPLTMYVHHALLYATFVLFVHVTLTVGLWLARRPIARPRVSTGRAARPQSQDETGSVEVARADGAGQVLSAEG